MNATVGAAPARAAPAVSVVVPAHDEAPNLVRLLAEVRAALDPFGITWELIVVDDGSSDGTAEILDRLAGIDARVRPLHLPHRRGQTAALAAGFAIARADRIATLDADLQCKPADLPALLAALDGADFACGVRVGRNDPLSRRVASACSNFVRRLVLAPRVRDLACPLRVFDAAALVRVRTLTPLFDGAHRWLPALFQLAGLRVVQRPVGHCPREAGTSKYTTRGRLGPVAREARTMLRLVLQTSTVARIAAVVMLLALASVPFLYALGAWPLMEPDEGRNAEVAREMVVLGNWSLPHFDFLPYLDKPVMLFWLIAGAFHALGVNELAARLPSALAGVATMALTAALGRRLLDVRRGLLAALIVGTGPLVIVFARLAIFDMPFTVFTTAALVCLVEARHDGRAERWLPLAGLAMALATLTKGPVGIVVPSIAWLAARGALPPSPHRTSRWAVLGAVAIFALVIGPWLVLVSRQEPAFLRYAFVDETLLRFVSSARFRRGGPVYYYVQTLAWALGAWGLVLAAVAPGLWRRWRAGDADAPAIAFAGRAALAIVLFFTCSASKRPQYILPAMVPLSLLVAAGIAADASRAVALVRASARWVLAPFAVIVLIAGLMGYRVTHGEFRVITPSMLIAVAIFLLAWATVVLASRGTIVIVASCALFAPLLGATLLGPLTSYAEGRSSRALAAWIGPSDRIVCFESFPTALPFYLQRSIPLVSDTAHELTSNYVIAQRGRLLGREPLLPVAQLADVLGTNPTYVLTSTWRIQRVRRLSPSRLESVYTGRREVLLRPLG